MSGWITPVIIKILEEHDNGRSMSYQNPIIDLIFLTIGTIGSIIGLIWVIFSFIRLFSGG